LNAPPIFSPVRSGRAAEHVALQIEAAIISGQLQPKDRLPSERTLQTQFLTSRGVIREAMSTLKQKGLVEIRKGAKGGAFVKQVEVPNVSESLSLFLRQHHIDPEHIIEFREHTDRAITIMAIARAGEDEKQELVKAAVSLKSMLAEPDPDMAEIGELDRKLNIRLARMTRNPIFEWIMSALQQGFSSHDYALYENLRYRERIAANWSDTAREIAANEPLKALFFISNHYFLLRRCIASKKVGQ